MARHFIGVILPFSPPTHDTDSQNNMLEMYYLCQVIYEAHKLVTYPFLTTGAPIDSWYLPIFLPTLGTEGWNKYIKQVLFMPSEVWGTQTGN